jgi:hypothetical protein
LSISEDLRGEKVMMSERANKEKPLEPRLFYETVRGVTKGGSL